MTRIQLFAGDITTLHVDAIVNAANQSLLGGGGVDGAIHAAAGPRLVAASRRLAPCPSGNAKMTPGFDLAARLVIHAVGPVFTDGRQGESNVLKQTYESALRLANIESLETIAFPCISTGAYGFPSDSACEIAIATVLSWQSRHQRPQTVVFCCFEQSDFELYADRLEQLGILHEYMG